MEAQADPPNPTFIRAHAAFEKVLNLCGAVQYLESAERDAANCGFLRENGETDVALLLLTRLVIADMYTGLVMHNSNMHWFFSQQNII